jgi:hypothetical protein
MLKNEWIATQWNKGGDPGEIPAPAPPPPPVVQKSVDVLQASRDQRMQQKRRRGFASTIKAGETGGYASETIMQRLGG